MGLSHLITILIIVLILFGANKLPQITKDIAKGLNFFRDEMQSKSDDEKDKN